ncbi:MAG TPA: serine hydrolase domain-containing protein [Candidatus Acidoferrum sp.]|nr:serine hydrolase domain-containing protein [Candidatus Acidoferrum sp.]
MTLSISGRHPGPITWLVQLAILFGAPVAGQAQNKTASPDYSPIISEFRASIPKLMSQQKVPGLAVVVVDNKGILWLEGFGYTDDDRKIAITPDTLFSVQSMSKNFTAAAVLVAVQDGLLDLDTPIKQYLPGFTVKSRFDTHPEEKITLRLLLSHRAGFTHEAPVGNNYDRDARSFEQHIRSISQTWLRFPIGQRYSYSNLGVDLAGYIVQVRSGMPFQQYVKHKVLGPIGMTSSSFDMEYISRSTQRAVGHSELAQEALEVPMIPAGGLYTNARELGRYVQFHLNGGKVNGTPIVEEQLLRQMYQIPSPLPGQTDGYGLGLGIELSHGTICLDHGGGGFGFLSKMIWYPEFGLGIGMLTNSSTHNFQNKLPNQILDRFIAAKLGRIPPEKTNSVDSATKVVDVPPARQGLLTGQYLYNRGGYMFLVFNQNRLGVEAPKFVPVVWTSEDEGYTPLDGVPYSYRFFRNSDGSPSYLVRMYDGEFLNYNVGPGDHPGAYNPEWDRYVGKYRLTIGGEAVGFVNVHKQNGELFLDYMKLEELQPGLFFTSHGETLDFRSTTPTWMNIQVGKVSIPVAPKAALVVCGLVFLSALVIWPILLLMRLIRARRKGSFDKRPIALEGVARFAAWLLALLNVALLYEFLTTLSFLIHFGFPWSTRLDWDAKVLYVALWMSPALALVVLAIALAVWKKASWSRLERLHYLLVTIAAVFVSAVFLAWNLPKLPPF